MAPCSVPRMLFLGVTTARSAIGAIFPEWAESLGIQLQLVGKDLSLQSDRSAYRNFIETIRSNEKAIRGALITSHKAAVFDHAEDLFDNITPITKRLGEVGMVYWRDGILVGDANDPLATQEVAKQILLDGCHEWLRGERNAYILGGGGAGLALAHTLLFTSELRCSRICIVDSDRTRCSIVKERVSQWVPTIPVAIQFNESVVDELISNAPPASLIVNATGLGKDRPGSPITEHAMFPRNAYVWEFNYRSIPQSLPSFLDIARLQTQDRHLIVEDGWNYFIWGWLQAICKVSQLDYDLIPIHRKFSQIASSLRPVQK